MSSNDFSKIDSHRIWIDHPYSIWTGKNGSDTGDSLARHHICGRNKEDPTLSSMYNCALILNNAENIAKHGELSKGEVKRELLQKVKKHIDRVVENGGYTRTEIDQQFLDRYKQYYE